MIRRHARYEALAGALLLGEATEGERREYAAHAAGCALCDELKAGDAQILTRLALVRDEETWRPALSEAVLTRIRERRAERWRLAFGAVSYGGALAVVLNVVVVSGFAGRLGDALHRPSSATAAVSALVAPAGGPALRSDATLAPAFDAKTLLFASTRKSAPAPHVARKARRAPLPARTVGPLPDAFGGLDFGSQNGARSVAVGKAGSAP